MPEPVGGGEPNLRRGRPPKHGAATLEVLQRIWRAAEQPCGKRLVALLGLWLPHYESEHGRLPASIRKQVRQISAAQVDRLLAPSKAQGRGRVRSGTKPGSLLKTQIPIRTDNWDIDRPGAHLEDGVRSRSSIRPVVQTAGGKERRSIPIQETDHHRALPIGEALLNEGLDRLAFRR